MLNICRRPARRSICPKVTTGKLTALLEGLNRKELLEMAKKAKALGKPDAAATVADFIEYVSNKE